MARERDDALLAHDLVAAGAEVGFLLRQALATELLPYAITPEQSDLLALLRAGHRTPSELARQTGRDKTTLSRVIARTVRAGLVEQTRSSDDRRRVALTLTARGITVVDQAERRIAARSPELVATLTAKEQRRLGKILRKLREALRA
jgi:DNA-binding MarR family transcriptional regulator